MIHHLQSVLDEEPEINIVICHLAALYAKLPRLVVHLKCFEAFLDLFFPVIGRRLVIKFIEETFQLSNCIHFYFFLLFFTKLYFASEPIFERGFDAITVINSHFYDHCNLMFGWENAMRIIFN